MMLLNEWRSLPLKKSWCHTSKEGHALRTEVRIDTNTGVDLTCTFRSSLLAVPVVETKLKPHGYIVATLISILVVALSYYLNR